MPLLREIHRAEVTSPIVLAFYDRLFGEQRDPVDEPGTATGTPGNWWTVLANVPDIMEHATNGFAMMRDPDRVLDSRIKELGRLRTAWTVQSQFVYSQHCKAGRSAGLTEEQIESVACWELATCYSEKERSFLALADALVLEHGRVAPDLGRKLTDIATDQEILEFSYSTLTYMLHAVLCRALRLEFDDIGERIVEIEAPEGDDYDVNAMISAESPSATH